LIMNQARRAFLGTGGAFLALAPAALLAGCSGGSIGSPAPPALKTGPEPDNGGDVTITPQTGPFFVSEGNSSYATVTFVGAGQMVLLKASTVTIASLKRP
jgi:hypothetical protein